MRMSVETLIDAPPHGVFAILADLHAWPSVISAIAGGHAPRRAVAVGTRFRETREMFGRKATEEMTVAEIEPPRRLILTAFNHGTAYRVEHLLAAEGTGTRVTLAFEGRPVATPRRGCCCRLACSFRGTVRRQLASDLADLGREAERRHRDGAPRSA